LFSFNITPIFPAPLRGAGKRKKLGGARGSIPVICKPNFVLMLINIYIPLCLFPFSFFFPFFVEKRKKKSKKKKSEKTKKRGEQLTVVIVRKTSFFTKKSERFYIFLYSP
jgi:hypothetical protein